MTSEVELQNQCRNLYVSRLRSLERLKGRCQEQSSAEKTSKLTQHQVNSLSDLRKNLIDIAESDGQLLRDLVLICDQIVSIKKDQRHFDHSTSAFLTPIQGSTSQLDPDISDSDFPSTPSFLDQPDTASLMSPSPSALDMKQPFQELKPSQSVLSLLRASRTARLHSEDFMRDVQTHEDDDVFDCKTSNHPEGGPEPIKIIVNRAENLQEGSHGMRYQKGDQISQESAQLLRRNRPTVQPKLKGCQPSPGHHPEKEIQSEARQAKEEEIDKDNLYNKSKFPENKRDSRSSKSENNAAFVGQGKRNSAKISQEKRLSNKVKSPDEMSKSALSLSKPNESSKMIKGAKLAHHGTNSTTVDSLTKSDQHAHAEGHSQLESFMSTSTWPRKPSASKGKKNPMSIPPPAPPQRKEIASSQIYLNQNQSDPMQSFASLQSLNQNRTCSNSSLKIIDQSVVKKEEFVAESSCRKSVNRCQTVPTNTVRPSVQIRNKTSGDSKILLDKKFAWMKRSTESEPTKINDNTSPTKVYSNRFNKFSQRKSEEEQTKNENPLRNVEKFMEQLTRKNDASTGFTGSSNANPKFLKDFKIPTSTRLPIISGTSEKFSEQPINKPLIIPVKQSYKNIQSDSSGVGIDSDDSQKKNMEPKEDKYIVEHL